MAKFMGNRKEDGIAAAVTLGTVLAMIISWSVHQSIIWCLLHGAAGWLYVLYYAMG